MVKGVFLIMEHFYTTINRDNWFDYSQLYLDMVNRFDNAKFVEVGSYNGRSAAFMGVEIINSGKDISFYCVDAWLGRIERTAYQEFIEHNQYLKDRITINNFIGGSHKKWELQHIYHEFLDNTKSLPIHVIRDLSDMAACHFADHSLDFVFIDADHDYEYVKKDIDAWFPKVKKGGILAGHDYHVGQNNVERAVKEWSKKYNITFQYKQQKYGSSWVSEIM